MSRAEIIDSPAGPARLQRSRRKTLAISVLPDGTLELTAPEGASLDPILTRVQRRLSWIERQRRHFNALNALRPQSRYVSGATHRYLGRQYRLKVSHGKPFYAELTSLCPDWATRKKRLESVEL